MNGDRAARGGMAVIVAAALAAAWLAIFSWLNGRVVVAVWNDRPLEDPWLDLVAYGFAALTLVGIPAVLAGVVAVSVTRQPGTTWVRRLAARVSFAVALSGPAEFVALGILHLLWR